MFFYLLLWSESGFPFPPAQCGCSQCDRGVVDMNYLRQSYLEYTEWNLRGPEQLQWLRFLGYTGFKQEPQAGWQSTACGIQLRNAPFKQLLDQMTPVLFRVFFLSFFFKKGGNLWRKLVGCISQESLSIKKRMILRFWPSEWRTGPCCHSRLALSGGLAQEYSGATALGKEWHPASLSASVASELFSVMGCLRNIQKMQAMRT